jgi:predicted CXXCH cytochrome family protein
MHVVVDFDRHANDYGAVTRDYNPALDLEGMESISFYVKVVDTGSHWIKNIKVRLRKPSGDFCVATYNTSNLPENAWQLVSIPRADFNDGTWADEGVNRINLRMFENSAPSSAEEDIYFDDISFSALPAQARDVVGDNATWGHYVTGHRFGCTSCHDPASDHIDGETNPLYGYFTSYGNPTGFRFYSDSSMGLQLPYTSYVPGSEGSFALCYTCHDEAVITQDAPGEALVTNFAEPGLIFASKDNLHLEHVGGPGSNMTPIVYHGTCVLCHDPHGQSNPAMTRTDMGDFIYFDAGGCEIARDSDSNTNGIKDWYDPDVNMGGAQQLNKALLSYPMCSNICHTVAAAPSDPCTPYAGSQGQDGWYARDYEYVPHEGNMDVGPICLTAGCHPVNKLHAGHFSHPTEFPLDETGCNKCHADGRLQCADEVLFKNVDQQGPPQYLSETGICATCHPLP